jgi:hypothetical protein
MSTPFQDFVNTELPKRAYTLDASTSWEAGKAVVTTGQGLGVTTQDFPVAPVTSVNTDVGDVVVTPLSIGAEIAGAAAAAQAAAVQRANHTGTQMASTISDLSSAIAAEIPHPLGRYEDESWLVEDFDTFYSVRPFTYIANADVTRTAVTGVSAGMADAHGVLRAYRTGFSPFVCLATGYETNSTLRTLYLSSNALVLSASFSVEGWGTDSDEIAYVLALSGAPLTASGDPRQDNSIMLIFDWNITNKIVAHTKSSGVLTETTATHTLAVNTRINATIVATSTSVKYYVNGTLIATHTTNIATTALCAWFGMCSYGASSQIAGFNIDIMALGRKFSTPRPLQLPVGYGG